MAKSFLDTLDDAFDDHVLSDLIPDARKPKPASTPRSSSGKGKTSSSRKKSFLSTIEENISEQSPKRVATPAPSGKPEEKRATSKRKSFLETIEEAYDQAAFDDIIPTRSWSRKEAQDFSPDKEFERQFGKILTPRVMTRVKEIADSKGIRVRDVIERALERYLQQEG